MNSIKSSLEEIQKILIKHNSEAKIIAVCKKQPISKVEEVISLGVKNLGINYINEFLEFKNNINSKDVIWHYIGRIQSNKLNKIVGYFDFIHSVSQFKNLEKINKIAHELGVVQKVFLQLNLSGEVSKSGFSAEEFKNIISKINDLNNIFLCGLMTMPPLGQGREYFEQLLALKKNFKESRQALANCDIKYLSMGTSGDYEDAIEFGATHIRLGTVLMGQRV